MVFDRCLIITINIDQKGFYNIIPGVDTVNMFSLLN